MSDFLKGPTAYMRISGDVNDEKIFQGGIKAGNTYSGYLTQNSEPPEYSCLGTIGATGYDGGCSLSRSWKTFKFVSCANSLN